MKRQKGSFANSNSKEKSCIRQGIDLALIKREVEYNVFSLEAMVCFILDCVRRACSRCHDITKFDCCQHQLRCVMQTIDEIDLEFAYSQEVMSMDTVY